MPGTITNGLPAQASPSARRNGFGQLEHDLAAASRSSSRSPSTTTRSASASAANIRSRTSGRIAMSAPDVVPRCRSDTIAVSTGRILTGPIFKALSVFCRHNRFLADCPICSKGTVLDPGRGTTTRRSGSAGSGARKRSAEKAPAFSGPHSAAGPYEHEDVRYLVRLEKVPGGIRLAEWAGSQLRRRAPVLPAADLPGLLAGAAGVLPERDATALSEALGNEPGASPGVSRGRSGDFKEELRVEDVGEGRIRIARWVLRPGSGWEFQDAPVMVPAGRLAEAVRGVVSSR